MSTAPDRTWPIRSGSDPSWPAGNRRSSIRPDGTSRTHSAASASLTLIGCAAGWEVATLYQVAVWLTHGAAFLAGLGMIHGGDHPSGGRHGRCRPAPI